MTGRAIPQGTPASVKAYIGGVAIGSAAGTGEATTLAVLCEAVSAPINSGATGDQDVTYVTNAAPTCPTTTGSEYKTIK